MKVTELGTLYCGDAKDILPTILPNSVDLVITDPPYPLKYIQCYAYLAAFCPPLMKKGASLLTIVPHYSLPTVVEFFKDRLKYRWLLHMNQFDGPHSRMAMGIEVTFKPILWYVKESYPTGRGFLKDGVKVIQDKEFHKWGQGLEWVEYYITKLTREGDLVLDPYIGGGSIAVVCEKLNRRWVGIDIDQYCIDTTIERIKENE